MLKLPITVLLAAVAATQMLTPALAAPSVAADKVLIARKSKTSIKWEKTVRDAFAKAQEEHKYIFVDVGAVW